MSAKGSIKGLDLGSEPRVQLLPPMVRQREQNRRTRRMLAFAVVVSVVVALGASAFAYIRLLQAEASLASAQQQQQTILAQQAEFAEASQIARLVEDTESAQRTVTANEVDWLGLLNALGGYVPAGASIATIALDSPAPWEAPLVPEGELRPERVATVSVTIASADYVLASAFVTAVYGLEGVEDAYITGTALDAGTYETTVSITFDEEVRLLRFAPAEEADDEVTTENTSDADGPEENGEAAP